MRRPSATLTPDGGLAAAADGWWRSDDARSRLVLTSDADSFASGWRRLRIEGVEADAPLHPWLELLGGESGDDLVEYVLPSIQNGRLDVVLHVERPFTRVAIAPSIGPALFRFGEVRFERMGLPRLSYEALRRNPRKAFEAGFARLRRKRLRSRNRLKAIFAPVPGTDYASWAAARARTWAQEARALAERSAEWAVRPTFAILVVFETEPDAGALAGLADTARSLVAQSWPDWRLIVAAPRATPAAGWPFDDPRVAQIVPAPGEPARRAARRSAREGWLTLAQPGDRFAPDALLRLAERARAESPPALIYGDDDALDARGHRRAPRFKPDFDVDYFCAFDYLAGPALALRADLVDADAARLDGAGLARLALSLDAASVAHVPVTLAHLVESPDRAEASAAPQRRAAIAEALADRARVEEKAGALRLRWTPPVPAPLVSVIVCTRDRLDLLRPCVEGLRHATDYPALEIVIADNDSEKPETRAYFDELAADPRVRVTPCPGPFNFAAINNRAARAARGAYLVFLNNDVEMLHPDWLTEMVALAARPEVGAVGARLLYPDGLIQHAGVIVGLNDLAGHGHRFLPADHPGYMRRVETICRYSAVTAACLCVRAETFFSVDGFDEALFPVAYNDVDLCLKIDAAGLANLYSPDARLLHKETASRPRDFSPERLEKWRRESGNLQKKWPQAIARDPWYNPNLTRTAEDWSLG